MIESKLEKAVSNSTHEPEATENTMLYAKLIYRIVQLSSNTLIDTMSYIILCLNNRYLLLIARTTINFSLVADL